ncbi:MAG: hypothetical protein IPO09_14770 [Anaeromyxobacter sp.]|nr:hypothetical protein [Anaeromyxobacter sp.]MBL0277140.1 hypothetical protein [Anaeromyxobacter sp.]
MDASVEEVRSFIEGQRPVQQAFFGAKAADKVLAFVASTSAAGSLASVTAHRLLGLERGAAASALQVSLAGHLPHQPGAGEAVTVCLFDQYVGYQVKTRPGGPGPAVEAGAASTRVRGSHVYTLHHSPFMMTAFERVPVDEVLGAVGRAPFALAAVGAQVNLSPRFNWHTAVRQGRLVLFHGDGLPLKTYLNLKSNPRVVRVLVDPRTFQGYVLEGDLEEYVEADDREAHQATCHGFAAGGWGKPARTFRFTAESIRVLAPQG